MTITDSGNYFGEFPAGQVHGFSLNYSSSDFQDPLIDGSSDFQDPLTDGSSDFQDPLTDGSSDFQYPLTNGSSDFQYPLTDISSTKRTYLTRDCSDWLIYFIDFFLNPPVPFISSFYFIIFFFISLLHFFVSVVCSQILGRSHCHNT